MTKKQGLLGLIFAMCLCLAMAMPAWAAENTEMDLYELANATVQVTQTEQESGAIVVTFENLDSFISEVRSNYPEISDIDLAKFIMDFTGQNSDGLSESEILDMLEYDNISTSSSFLLINDEKDTVVEITEEQAMIMQLADSWTSTDKLLQIETDFSKTKTVGSNKYYTIWSRATWLVRNPNGYEDVFILGCSNATSDDSFNEQGNVNRSYTCTNCSRVINKYYSVDSNSQVNADLSMNYANFAPYIRFLSLKQYCDSCLENDYAATNCTLFKAYIKYGVIVNGNSNIQAAYGHKTKGTANLNVGISADGIPSISISPQKGEVKTYNAKYVTLK